MAIRWPWPPRRVLLCTAEGGAGSGVASREVVAAALRDLVPSYGEVFQSRVDGLPSLEVAAPISAADNVRIPAALLVRYNLRKLLYDFIENRTGMGLTPSSWDRDWRLHRLLLLQ